MRPRKILLGAVEINDVGKSNIMACLREERIGQGRFIKEFEDAMKKYMGFHHAFMTSTGEMADCIGLNALDNDGTKDEVIVPALTFVAQANAILHAGYWPVFCDVDVTGQMDPHEIKPLITERTLALMPAHLLGRVAQIEEIKAIGDTYNIPLMEDCCEALGATYNLQPVGSWGKTAAFSFYATHTICTGEGGLVIAHDQETASNVASIRNHGRAGEGVLELFAYDRLGYNGKSSNLHAAIGVSVVKTLDRTVTKRRENVDYLNKELGMSWYKDRPFEKSSPHCYPVFYKNRADRNDGLINITLAGIECRPVMSNCARLGHLRKYARGEYPMADKISSQGLYVPCHQNLSQNDLDYIVEILSKEDCHEVL